MTETVPSTQERSSWLDRPLVELRLPRELDIPRIVGRFRPPSLVISPDTAQKVVTESTGRFEIVHSYKEQVVKPRKKTNRAVPLVAKRPTNRTVDSEKRWRFGRIEADKSIPPGESRLTLRGKEAVLLVNPEEVKGRWSISYGKRKNAEGRVVEGMAVTVTRKDKTEEGTVKHQTRVELAPEQLRVIAIKRRAAALAAAAAALLIGLVGSERRERQSVAWAAHSLEEEKNVLRLPEIPRVPGVEVPLPEKVRPRSHMEALTEKYRVEKGDTLMEVIRRALEKNYPSARREDIEAAAVGLKNYALVINSKTILPNAEGEHPLIIGQEIELPGMRVMADCMKAVQNGEIKERGWWALACPPVDRPRTDESVIPSKSKDMQKAVGLINNRLGNNGLEQK